MTEEEYDLSWPDDLEAFAESWMAEVRAGAEPKKGDFGGKVVTMNFLAPAAIQWAFLLEAVAAAQSDEELGSIAAGPFEHLLAFHGADYIDAVEAKAREDAKFARMTLDSWRHSMTDDVWARLQAIQQAARDTAGQVGNSPYRGGR